MTKALEIIVGSLASLWTVTFEVILVGLNEIPSVLIKELEASLCWALLASRNNHSFIIFSTCENEVHWGTSVIILKLSKCTRIVVALLKSFS